MVWENILATQKTTKDLADKMCKNLYHKSKRKRNSISLMGRRLLKGNSQGGNLNGQ